MKTIYGLKSEWIINRIIGTASGFLLHFFSLKVVDLLISVEFVLTSELLLCLLRLSKLLLAFGGHCFTWKVSFLNWFLHDTLNYEFFNSKYDCFHPKYEFFSGSGRQVWGGVSNIWSVTPMTLSPSWWYVWKFGIAVSLLGN